MRSRQIAYALLQRDHAGITQVLLERRPLSASLMPGMWELPEVDMLPGDQDRVEIALRHAITVTNYRVQVLRFSEDEASGRWPAQRHLRRWAKSGELGSLPLTGLARKILQRLQIMSNSS
jgi:A/G-specific adenine glycosylase